MVSRANTKGFTLIETMIVLVVLGILMTFAMPLYQDSARKVRRAEAKRELLELALRQERYYAQHREYSADINSDQGLNYRRTQTENGMYDLLVDACHRGGSAMGLDRCYRLIARPRPGSDQRHDTCGELSVDGLGLHAATGPAHANCW